MFVQIIASGLLAVCLADSGTCAGELCSTDQISLLQARTDIKPGPKREERHWQPKKQADQHHRQNHRPVQSFGIHPGLGGPADAPQLLSASSTGNMEQVPPDVAANNGFSLTIPGTNPNGVHSGKPYSSPLIMAASVVNAFSGGHASDLSPVMTLANIAQDGMDRATTNKIGLDALKQTVSAVALKQGSKGLDGIDQNLNKVNGQTLSANALEGVHQMAIEAADKAAGAAVGAALAKKMETEAFINKEKMSRAEHYKTQSANSGYHMGTLHSMPVSAPADVPPAYTCPVDRQGLPNGQGDLTHWRCMDGTCVFSEGRCDGAQNCNDGSDELFCNKLLFSRVSTLGTKDTELRDEIAGVRSGGDEPLMEFGSVDSLIQSLNVSLRSDFADLRKVTSPHLKVQSQIEATHGKVEAVKRQLEGLKAHDDKRVEEVRSLLKEQIFLREAFKFLEQRNTDLKSDVDLLKKDFGALQAQQAPDHLLSMATQTLQGPDTWWQTDPFKQEMDAARQPTAQEMQTLNSFKQEMAAQQ